MLYQFSCNTRSREQREEQALEALTDSIVAAIMTTWQITSLDINLRPSHTCMCTLFFYFFTMNTSISNVSSNWRLITYLHSFGAEKIWIRWSVQPFSRRRLWGGWFGLLLAKTTEGWKFQWGGRSLTGLSLILRINALSFAGRRPLNLESQERRSFSLKSKKFFYLVQQQQQQLSQIKWARSLALHEGVSSIGTLLE